MLLRGEISVGDPISIPLLAVLVTLLASVLIYNDTLKGPVTTVKGQKTGIFGLWLKKFEISVADCNLLLSLSLLQQPIPSSFFVKTQSSTFSDSMLEKFILESEAIFALFS